MDAIHTKRNSKHGQANQQPIIFGKNGKHKRNKKQRNIWPIIRNKNDKLDVWKHGIWEKITT